jgi:hypothetical protein
LTHSTSSSKKNNHEASEALSDVSRLLSRLAKSRKAPSKLQDIIDLTREVARLGRAVNCKGTDHDDGYGDPDHFANISKDNGDRKNLIR